MCQNWCAQKSCDSQAAGFKVWFCWLWGHSMAAPLERQLKAAQKFLRGVQSLPTFGDIQRKQVNELQRFFLKVDYLSTDASARLLEVLKPQLWNHHTDELRQKIVDRTGKDDPSARKSNQDYLAAVCYLSASLVAKLERDRNRVQVLELLCQHLVRLPGHHIAGSALPGHHIAGRLEAHSQCRQATPPATKTHGSVCCCLWIVCHAAQIPLCATHFPANQKESTTYWLLAMWAQASDVQG